MNIQPTQLTFGYHHPIKTYWLKGKMPSVTRGLYGELLTPKTVSIEHLTPVSKGGKTELGNVALADKQRNHDRGSEPIEKFVTIGMLQKYFKQFKGIKLPHFNGDEYIQKMKDYFKNVVDGD